MTEKRNRDVIARSTGDDAISKGDSPGIGAILFIELTMNIQILYIYEPSRYPIFDIVLGGGNAPSKIGALLTLVTLAPCGG